MTVIGIFVAFVGALTISYAAAQIAGKCPIEGVKTISNTGCCGNVTDWGNFYVYKLTQYEINGQCCRDILSYTGGNSFTITNDAMQTNYPSYCFCDNTASECHVPNRDPCLIGKQRTAGSECGTVQFTGVRMPFTYHASADELSGRCCRLYAMADGQTNPWSIFIPGTCYCAPLTTTAAPTTTTTPTTTPAPTTTTTTTPAPTTAAPTTAMPASSAQTTTAVVNQDVCTCDCTCTASVPECAPSSTVTTTSSTVTIVPAPPVTTAAATTDAITTAADTTEPITTTTEPTTTTTEATTTTTEATTTTEPTTTTTTPALLCPIQMTSRMIGGTPEPVCSVTGVIRLSSSTIPTMCNAVEVVDPNTRLSTMYITSDCGDVFDQLATSFPINGSEDTTTFDWAADVQPATPATVADGVSAYLLDPTLLANTCAGPACVYNPATMSGLIDLTSCSMYSYGADGIDTASNNPTYTGNMNSAPVVQSAGCTPVHSADECWSFVDTSVTLCGGDSGSPILCDIPSTGETVLYGMAAFVNSCGTDSTFAVSPVF